MKRLESQGDTLSFQLSLRERFLLVQALHRYPMLPVTHHRISRSPSTEMVEPQKLLDEAIEEQHQTVKSKVSDIFKNGQCLKTSPDGSILTLTITQRELLIQCLNDVRVGCWIEIGSPDEDQRKSIPQTDHNVKHLMLMDLCAYFQYGLIHGNVPE